MIMLVCISGTHKGEEHIINDGVSVIGRSADCGITIADRMVSRHHCKIVKHGRLMVIEDTKSSHGVMVNGNKILADTVVNMGDKIQIGKTVFLACDRNPKNGDQSRHTATVGDIPSRKVKNPTSMTSELPSALDKQGKKELPKQPHKKTFLERISSFFSGTGK